MIAEPIELNDELTRFFGLCRHAGKPVELPDVLELQDVAELFPFACRVSKEELVADERFEVNNFGGEFSVGGTGVGEYRSLLRRNTFATREKHIVNRKLQDLQFTLLLGWYQRRIRASP